MTTPRREFLRQTAAGAAGALVAGQLSAAEGGLPPRIRVGACVVGLEQAKLAGLDGVEVGVGNPADRLSIAEPATIARYQEQMQRTGLPIQSLMMGLLNNCPLATDPRGPAWLEQAIEGAQAVGAKVILVAFFGQGNLRDGAQLKENEVTVAVERLKAAAPRAEQAGVLLAIENTLSGAQNAAILDRINHPAVQLYYDVGNSTNNGYDVPAEIRALGQRIVQFHFKDGPNFLGEGKVQYDPIVAAMKEIGYQGWVVLETSSPTKDAVADARRNGEFTRRVLGLG